MPELIEKRIIIIAGPNGAGKTTFAREFLPNEASCPLFVNADLIADGLSPFDPSAVAVRAGRLMKKVRPSCSQRSHLQLRNDSCRTALWPTHSALATEWLSGPPDFSATSK